MQQLRMLGFPEAAPTAAEPEHSPDAEPTPIPALFRRAEPRPKPVSCTGWQQSLELEFGPAPIQPEFEARLQIRMLVSGRIKGRTFLAWLAASGHRLARLPRDHEIHRILDVLAPELTTRRSPPPAYLVARLEQAGLSEGALAVTGPHF